MKLVPSRLAETIKCLRNNLSSFHENSWHSRPIATIQEPARQFVAEISWRPSSMLCLMGFSFKTQSCLIFPSHGLQRRAFFFFCWFTSRPNVVVVVFHIVSRCNLSFNIRASPSITLSQIGFLGLFGAKLNFPPTVR